ncbi:hypothetical protein PUN28_000544 [Cardiocondyla obscurior]|uniref:Uncharacterized protein n=1 Tax=Cardiocondyla obscurior TaxID=286306 RepID=A0AAW2H021_9HYME
MNITLIKERHQVIINGDLPLFDCDGNILVQDVQDNNIFGIPVCEDTLKFFNLNFTEETSLDDNSNSNNVCMITEQGEPLVSSVYVTPGISTASWKDDNEVRCLIHLWRDHQNCFKK